MIGGTGSNGQQTDLSKYLINFNSADWANQANAHLQDILQQGLNYANQNNQQAVNATQAYQQQANNALNQGFQQSQVLTAPQRLSTYNALDAYNGTLGLPSPVGGSAQMVNNMAPSVGLQPSLLQGAK